MKKTILLAVTAFFAVLCVQSQTLNNPKDGDGYYIVKWDCSSNTWASSNNFEVDETFTFAVDVTGTPFEEWLRETPTATGATRSLAINKWTSYGDVSGNTNRMKQISGNIYGATWNIIQMAGTMDVEKATGIDSTTYVYGQVFGFEYTADSPGAGWWMWPAGVPEGTAIDPGTGAIFKTLRYTGTKTSSEFYNDDFGNDLFGNDYPEKGYAPACAVTASVENPLIDNGMPIVKYEYFNILGEKLLQQPETGIYIEKAIRANGTFSSKKIMNVQPK